MAKEISGYIKLQIMGGQANPAPPVGPAGPTGGAGLACPPIICNFIYPLISFAINLLSLLGYILNQLVLVFQKLKLKP